MGSPAQVRILQLTIPFLIPIKYFQDNPMQYFSKLFSSDQKQRKTTSPNQQILRLFDYITDSKTKFTSAKKTLYSFILQDEKNVHELFTFLENPSIPHYPSPFSILQLLATIHSLFSDQNVQNQLSTAFKQKKIQWIIRDDITFIERMITEPSTSSMMCGNANKQVRSATPKDLSKAEVQEEKSRKQQAIHNKRQEKYFKNQKPSSNNPEPITPQRFCQFYYSYLQKVAVNLDLYIAIKQQRYPYDKSDEVLENKIKLMWLYKIQNLIEIGITLLEEKTLSIEVYTLVGQDMEELQDFIVQQVHKFIGKNENYSHMCASDLLSVNEIYQDCVRQQSQLTRNKLLKPLSMDRQLLDEFQMFIIRIKVLSQVQFKKKIQVPNKDNPYWLLEQKTEPDRQVRASSLEKKMGLSAKKRTHHRQRSSFEDNEI